MKKQWKIAVAGLGSRGGYLLPDAILPVCKEYDAEVAMVYDPYEDRVAKAVEEVQKATNKAPIAAKSYQEILDNPEIDAVIVTAAWEAHIDLAIKAMYAGKRVGVEVGGAYALQDCWRLVEAYEKTGIHCMLLENCCYGEVELLALNMVRQGLFGNVVHCEGGYHHDLRYEVADGQSLRHYRLRNYMNRNCENYPTHELGPIAKILDINNGNRMVSLTSTASCAKGLHEYIVEKKGADHPLAAVNFAQGDVVTTVIKCAGGQTITLVLDTTLPRIYSRGFTVRGTKGYYMEDGNIVFLDGLHEEHWTAEPFWNNAKEYCKTHAHPLWKDYDPQGGHGGMDYLVMSAFFEALTTGKRPPIDTYDTAAWMAITPLSEASIQKGSMPVEIPDFTRGRWYMRDDIEPLHYGLDRMDVNAELYDHI